MSFLAPLFLFGALAVALPVIFHLIRRATRERTPFSSLIFLTPTPPRLTRRSRLEHLLLLLLRCAALCLLALGFARPLFHTATPTAPPAAAPRRVLLLVDTSASMRRANLWSDAKDKVNAILRQVSPADQVALFTFDREARPLITFAEWNAAAPDARAAMASARLAATSPGWAATRTGSALIAAAETLADTGGKAAPGLGQIVLISDLQEGSHVDVLQGYQWPKDVELRVEPLKAKHISNAGLQLAAGSEEAQPGAGVRLRVSNAAESRRQQFKVGWTQPGGVTFLGQPLDIYVPPGQSRMVTLPPPLALPIAPDRITLQGDEEDFDNTVFVAPPETTRQTVLYCGSESERDAKQPLYFLKRAFQETGRQTVSVVSRAPGAATETDFKASTLIILADPLPEAAARGLHEQAAAGKPLLCLLRSAAMGQTLARLLGLEQSPVEEARPASYAMLAEIDFRHPLFAPFADPRFSDFTKIHFWKYRRLDLSGIPGARVVAKFDNADPALVEVPVGQGRVLVLTSGWQPEDSQLALSTKFVPLLYSMLETASVTPPVPLQYCVGDTLALGPEARPSTAPLSIRTPDGSQAVLPAGATNFLQTLVPGIYSLVSTQGQRRFAVNLDAAENRTAPLPSDELEHLGVPLSQVAAASAHEPEHKSMLQNAELESRQRLWRWLIVAALGVLLLESWLAGRAARRLTTPSEGGTT